ncbi:GNAT family N-acetyltransferase [Dehalobacterium formicoaceticum]|uniref:GNAT family N-acetyltransferase n=1 Tax=Dehalobacterium formicoaceticum TaxID=51515 RepID=UPI000B7D6B68|nr:GNAT family N-acetyltransferase [Dehalobacterium formicoaceticum]
MIWVEFNRAQDIPGSWDNLTGANIFLKRAFLAHLEKTNPCQQRYRMLFDAGMLQALYVVYQLKLNVFTYRSLPLRIPVLIIGIPCSVAKQGFVVQEGYDQFLADDIHSRKGAHLILNSTTSLPGKSGATLPSCHLDLAWKSMDQYLAALRSHYRYRLKKARAKWQDVKVELIKPRQFEPILYQQYLEVYQRSQFKLEQLSLDFFRNLPLPAQVIKASFQDQVLGFALLVENGAELVFLFTGFDHALNPSLDIYLNLLLEVINYGLIHDFKVIDFGQTTEEIKEKLGCRLQEKRMWLFHSNPFLHNLANRLLGFLEYQKLEHHYRVFIER